MCTTNSESQYVCIGLVFVSRRKFSLEFLLSVWVWNVGAFKKTLYDDKKWLRIFWCKRVHYVADFCIQITRMINCSVSVCFSWTLQSLLFLVRSWKLILKWKDSQLCLLLLELTFHWKCLRWNYLFGSEKTRLAKTFYFKA